MNIHKNRTYTYLLPKLASVVKLEKKEVINLFLGIEGKTKDFDGNVYAWVTDNTKVESNYLIDDYIVGENRILEFDYPCDTTYTSFVTSKYSKIPDETKKIIINYHKGSSNFDKIRKILYKHHSLREEIEDEYNVKLPKNSELGEKIVFKNEIYKNE